MDFQHFDDIEDSTRDLQWRRSSRCGTAACVDVARDGDKILVRDGKFGTVSNTLTFSVNEWLEILEAVRHGVQTLDLAVVDGGVWFGGVEDGLFFNSAEWRAFEEGVLLWEFEPERLSSPAPASEGEQVADEVGSIADGSDLAATGAGEVFADSGEPVPVAALEAVTETIRADQLTPGRTVLIPMTESVETVTQVRVSGSYVTVHTNGTGPDFSYQWPAGEEISAVVVVPPVPVVAQPREISDELVEMVARAQYEYDTDDIPTDLGYAWDETIAAVRNEYVRRARAGLEVAIPLLRKQWENEPEPAWGSGPLVDHNPFAGGTP